MPEYNGILIIWMDHYPEPDFILASDACMTAAGGIKNDEVFAVKFPGFITEGVQIAHLELWAIIGSLKLWGLSTATIRQLQQSLTQAGSRMENSRTA